MTPGTAKLQKEKEMNIINIQQAIFQKEGGWNRNIKTQTN